MIQRSVIGSVVLSLLLGTPTWAQPWNDHLLQANVGWTQAGPASVDFTVTALFRRDAFGGLGAPIVTPGKSGVRGCPTCPPGQLPQAGDILFEGVGGTRLVFGDGTDTPILCFQVDGVDAPNNLLFATAIDPELYNRGSGPISRVIHHDYTRPGEMNAYLSTCCQDALIGHQNGLLILPGPTLPTDPTVPLPPSARHAIWRGLRPPGNIQNWHIMHRNLDDGSLPAVLSSTSTDNQSPWLDEQHIVWSGMSPDFVRQIYHVALDQIGATPAIISPPGFTDNNYPKVRGDWVLAIGVPPGGTAPRAWARNLRTMAPPLILSEAAHPHLAVSRENALWVSWNAGHTDTQVVWQDLLDPSSRTTVDDGRGSACRASGDIYSSLRVYQCTVQPSEQTEVFFRTIPLVTQNPSIILSTTLADGQSPRIHGVQALFEDSSGMLWFVNDVLRFQEDAEFPMVLNDPASVALPPLPPLSAEEPPYSLSRDWAVWAGNGPGGPTVFARNLAGLPGSPIVPVSQGIPLSSQPWSSEGTAVWRGLNIESSTFAIFSTRLDGPPVATPVSDDTTLDNDMPRVIEIPRTDSDGDGVTDELDACPNTVLGMAVDAHGCPAWYLGDLDLDGDVDAADRQRLVACMSGPTVEASIECMAMDLDEEGSIDQMDFGLLQAAFTGTNVPASTRSEPLPSTTYTFERLCDATPVIIVDNSNGKQTVSLTVENTGLCDIVLALAKPPNSLSVTIKPSEKSRINVGPGYKLTRTCLSAAHDDKCGGSISVNHQSTLVTPVDQTAQDCGAGTAAATLIDNSQGKTSAPFVLQNTGTCPMTVTFSGPGTDIAVAAGATIAAQVPKNSTATWRCPNGVGTCSGSLAESGPLGIATVAVDRDCDNADQMFADNRNGTSALRATVTNTGQCNVSITISGTTGSLVVPPGQTTAVKVPKGATANARCSGGTSGKCTASISVGTEASAGAGSFDKPCGTSPMVIDDNGGGESGDLITFHNTGVGPTACTVIITVSPGGDSITIRPNDVGMIKVPKGRTATVTCSGPNDGTCAGEYIVSGE